MRRDLDWDGLVNVRDLGGLPTVDGRRTRRGAVVRSEALSKLTPAGWRALRDYGIRTIVDLRDDEERDLAEVPGDLTTVQVALDTLAGQEFRDAHQSVDGTPMYLLPYLQQVPHGGVAALAAIARAEPGGVLVHCAAGRDRTGIVSVLLLALAGVLPEEIAADYEHSAERLRPLLEAAGHGWLEQYLADALAKRGSSVRGVLLEALEWLDIESYLLRNGLSEADITALRQRILG